MPRPVRLAGQRLRRRPDKRDAGCRRHKLHITHFRRCRRRKLAHSAAPPSSRRNRFAGFRREPCWEVIKTPVLHFFGISVWGWYHYPRAAVAVSEEPRAGFIQQKKRLSQSGCSAPTDTLFPPAHSAFSALLCGGWYHYPRRALHAVETLDARGSRRRIYRFYAVPEFALCGLNLPSSGTHATPAPNRAHSGSHAETRRVLRVDGDDVSGSGIIDPIGSFQADQTVAVALAEGHRDAVSS